MLKKTSNNPHNYESDAPQEDMKRFEDAMTHLVKVPPKHRKYKASKTNHRSTSEKEGAK
jgi:hypothetical protein